MTLTVDESFIYMDWIKAFCKKNNCKIVIQKQKDKCL
jgi:hypothetical protein